MFIIKTSRDVGTIWENYLTQIQHIQYITAINEKEKIFSYLLCVFPSPHHIQSFWLEFIIVSRCPQVLVMLMHTYPPTQIHTHTHTHYSQLILLPTKRSNSHLLFFQIQVKDVFVCASDPLMKSPQLWELLTS